MMFCTFKLSSVAQVPEVTMGVPKGRGFYSAFKMTKWLSRVLS